MPLLTNLLILIVLARLLGQLFARLGQPAIVGEILAGVILGQSVLNLISPGVALTAISELAVFFIILSAGLEMNFKEILKSFKGKGLVIALLSFTFPFFSGVLVGSYFGLDPARTIILGMCISVTALPVAVRILQSFKMLNSEIARYAIGAAIVNDIIVFIMLGVILALPGQWSYSVLMHSVLSISLKLLLLAGLVCVVNWILNREKKRGARLESFSEKCVQIFGDEALFGIVILFVLTFGAISDFLGFQFIIGAFFGALMVDKDFFSSSRYIGLNKNLTAVTEGFLAPVFFVFLGLKFNVVAIPSVEFMSAVLAVSVFSKLLAGYCGGKWIGLSRKNSLGVGIILNGRGVMELVIASLAFEKGLIDQGLFSALVMMAVVTTVMTPVLFRKFILP